MLIFYKHYVREYRSENAVFRQKNFDSQNIYGLNQTDKKAIVVVFMNRIRSICESNFSVLLHVYGIQNNSWKIGKSFKIMKFKFFFFGSFKCKA